MLPLILPPTIGRAVYSKHSFCVQFQSKILSKVKVPGYSLLFLYYLNNNILTLIYII